MLGSYGKKQVHDSGSCIAQEQIYSIDYHSYNFVSYLYHLFSYISALHIMNETPDMCSINLQTQRIYIVSMPNLYILTMFLQSDGFYGVSVHL